MFKIKIIVLGIVALTAVCVVSEAAVLFDRVVAVVNQEVITWSELYKNMEADASPQLREMKEQERLKVFRSSEPQFLESLINYRLQLQEARSTGVKVGEEELKEAVEGIKKKYAMSDNDFSESLKKEGFTLEEYRMKLMEQILISKIVNQQVRSKILVSDADVKKFLEENRDAGNAAGGYRISQIFFKNPKNAEERKAVEAKAGSVAARIKGGEDFQALARQYSEEPMGSTGGDLGFIKKEHLMKEFAAVISSMKTGDVSAPFWTERGLHVIRLDASIAPKDTSEITSEARKEAGNRIFMEKYNAWIKSLREKAFIEIKL
ncbi:MAG: peptidylprolyl isomerase [Thermodesulfovibrionales bacterium]